MKQYIVDAFAEKLFTGNPAAVCVLDEWLTDSLMQKIALENNLSETAFLVKEEDCYYIRWFTPNYEIDLCGHATLAASYVIKNFIDKQIEKICFNSTSGELNVFCKNNIFTLDFPARNFKKVENLKDAEEALNVHINELYLSRDLIAVVSDEEIVKQLKPDYTKVKNLKLGDGIIVTAAGKDCDFVSRCFYPKCGVNEDPVTGSAHCNLIPYWAERLKKSKMTAKQISLRGGTLYCEYLGERVHISGKAILYAASELNI